MNSSSFVSRLAVSALLIAPAFAQTSGTYSGQTDGDWSTIPWTNLVGPAPYPTAGGSVTFNGELNTVVGTPFSDVTVTIDRPDIVLSGLTFDSPFAYDVAGDASHSLGLADSGATIHVARSPVYSSSFLWPIHLISAPITGGGAAGLTKTGAGSIRLRGINTYTGGTHLRGGTLLVDGDAALGATGPGNDLSFDGGTLETGAELTSARNIVLGAGGGTLVLRNATSLSGVISGEGAFRTANPGQSGALTLTGANTYTGATQFGTTGTVTLSGGGRIASSSSYDLLGALVLDNSTANENDRLNDAAPITSRGATISLIGNASAPTAETIGALTLAGGTTTLLVNANAAQSASLNLASITRDGPTMLYLRGNISNITSAVSPGTLVGGGGAAGSTTMSILPWAFANASATLSVGLRFATWDASTGAFRALNNNEFTNDFTSPTSNVRILATTAAPTATVNSLLLAPGAGATTLSGGPITITSGAFLFSPTLGASGTVSAGLDFGSAQGYLTSTATLTVSGAISGSGGLVINGHPASPSGSITINVTGANTYTGETTLLAGSIRVRGLVAADGVTPGPLGLSQTPVVFRAGSTPLALTISGNSTFNRDLEVLNTGPRRPKLEVINVSTLAFNGAIDLQGPLGLGGTNGSTMALNGLISGPGGLVDESLANWVTINRANTFSGGVAIYNSRYGIGADHALGTGPLTFTDANGSLESTDATARTLGNPILFAGSPIFRGTGSLILTGPVDLNGDANLNGAATIDVVMTGGAKTIFTGDVKNGAITKTGAGILTLANPAGNSYPGGTLLGANAGTLEVNNATGSGTGGGTLAIGPGSTLAGNFTISGATRIAGTLAPGPVEGGIGTANFGGNLTLADNSATNLEIASADLFDTIHVGGTLTLTSSTVINVVTTNGYAVQWGESFKLFGWTILASDGFIPAAQINVSGATLTPGQHWDLTNFLTSGTITAVPEPRDTALALVVLLGVVVLFRRRRFLAP